MLNTPAQIKFWCVMDPATQQRLLYAMQCASTLSILAPLEAAIGHLRNHPSMQEQNAVPYAYLAAGTRCMQWAEAAPCAAFVSPLFELALLLSNGHTDTPSSREREERRS